MTLAIRNVPIGKLVPDPQNVRQHDAKNLDAICRSLSQFGQRKPIVVARGNDGSLVVIAGNGTLEAAKLLGWTELAVAEVPSDWDADKARAYAIADNRTAELANWNDVALASALLDLDSMGWDLADIGFEPIDPNVDELAEDEFDAEPPAEPVAKLGDIWTLGRHRLICGDSTDDATIKRLLDGAKADMAFTDPPYGVEYTGGVQFDSAGNVERNNREMIKNDDVDIYPDVFRILSMFVTGACYVWFAGSKAKNLYAAAEKYGDIHSLLIWHKTGGGYANLNANYKENKEPFLYWKPKGATLKFVGASTETTVWQINKDGRNEFHPTQKPVALAAKALGNHDAKTVLDLFGGSGATLIAAEQVGRTCFMAELDPRYCDVIIKRWETLTGQKAVRHG